ncbi:MAG: tRNA guanosine(34) transglycosylase Tgt [Candidatus Paceibacterota bacterium]
MTKEFGFKIEKKLANGLGRAGVIQTPHGEIKTPAFIVVATKANVKSLTVEQVKGLGAQAVLANTYHLYLEPGDELVKKAGGFPKMMNWQGPTFTDSGGFQAFSLGVAFGTTITKLSKGETEAADSTKNFARSTDQEPLAKITEDGVEFKSYRDGSKHFFTPEKSMEIQRNLGADIIFAFDECTSPTADKKYQKEAMERTHRWAARSLERHRELQAESEKLKVGEGNRKQALFGIVQGGRFQDLRKESAEVIGKMDFDGFGIGGSFDKTDIGLSVGLVNKILPEEKPRHLLGIGEPEDMFLAIENGCDTFDCVAPTRTARNGTLYTKEGRIHIENNQYREDLGPIEKGCGCYTCKNYSVAYLSFLHRAHELTFHPLASIHNLYFLVNLVDKIRQSILDGNFEEFKNSFLKTYK